MVVVMEEGTRHALTDTLLPCKCLKNGMKIRACWTDLANCGGNHGKFCFKNISSTIERHQMDADEESLYYGPIQSVHDKCVCKI